MGAFSLTSIGVRALAANYAALHTTGHNISNANVAGYSRQQVELAATPGQYTGGGFLGHGVDVSGITRQHNVFLTAEAARTASLAAMDDARLNQLRGLEAVFRTGEQGLGAVAGAFLNAMSDMASNPSDAAVRQVVLARAADMVARFNEAGQALDTLQAGITSDMEVAVSTVNNLADSLAKVNQRIAAAKGTGKTPNDLLDQRDQIVARIGEYVQVTRIEAADGSMGLFIAGGQSLVLGSQSSQLEMLTDPSDPRRVSLGLKRGPVTLQVDPQALGGGSMAGLMRFQNSDLTEGRALIGRMATVVGMAVNAQQQRGINLLGTVPTPPLFGLPAPQVVPDSRNATGPGGAPVGVVTVGVAGDPAALRASDYLLRADPATPGNWLITRLVDGQPSRDAADSLSFSGTSAIFQGVALDFTAAPPAAGDSFVLRTVSRAANGMELLLRDPRDLAAAAPLTASSSPGNTGTAQPAGLQVLAAPVPFPGLTARLTFVDNSANDPANPLAYTVQMLNADGSVASSDNTPRRWVAGGSIPGSNPDINGFTLRLSGVPRPGDTVLVAPASASTLQTNNGNALALLALRDAPLLDGKSISAGYAQAIADISARVQTAKSTSELSAAVADQAEQARSGASGVNLDEEAARLIQFQQSYQAAAKMLQVAQSVFDTLLQAAGR